METKKDLRKEAAAVRDGISPLTRKAKSDRIAAILRDSELYHNADALIVYVTYRSEVDTVPIIEYALADEKSVFCPKVSGERISFFKLTDLIDLKNGYNGILEPLGATELFTKEKYKNPLVLVPGLLFAPDGSRLGYGGGFYDRFLFENSSLLKVGLCYSEQIREAVIMDPHDMRMDHLLTEESLIDCKQQQV